MASSLAKVVDALVQQGSRDRASAVLPHWLTEGAALQYISMTSGEPQAHDVIVESISQSKRATHSRQQVRFVFARDSKVYKLVTFQQILAGKNPLRQKPRRRAGLAEDADSTNDVKIVEKASQGSDEEEEMDKVVGAIERGWAQSDSRKKSEMFGPKLGKVPDKWKRPDVTDIDSSPERTAPAVQDLDMAPSPPEPENKDPYGLEEALAKGEFKLPGQQAAGSGAAKRRTRGKSSRSRSQSLRRDAKYRAQSGRDARARSARRSRRS